MKKILFAGIGLFFALTLLFSGTALAQKDSTLSQRITKTFCDEFSKKDLSKVKPDALDVEMGLVILNVIAKYEEDIKKEWGLSIDNEADMEKIGERIGRDAALSCPAFRDYVVNNLDAIGGDDEGDAEKSLTGNFSSLQAGAFSYIVLKTKGGKEEKLWWFEHFPGADDLMSKPDSFKSKSVTVKYKELEIYDGVLKEYRKIKVLTKFSVE